MSFIAPGFVWTDTDGQANSTCTSDNLATFLDGALATSITLGEWSTDAHLVHVTTGEPSSAQGERSIWWDTTNNYLRTLRSSGWDAVDVGPELTNSTGSAIVTGMNVAIVTADTMEPTATAAWPMIVGIVTENVADGSSSVVQQSGRAGVLVNGPCEPGDVLLAVAGGWAQSATFANSANTATASVAFAQAMVSIGAVTALVDSILYGG